jgi:hypothetical protein
MITRTRAYRRFQQSLSIDRAFEIEWPLWRKAVNNGKIVYSLERGDHVADMDDVMAYARRRANHPALCSCRGCGGHSRYWEGLTRQEIRGIYQERDMIEEAIPDPEPPDGPSWGYMDDDFDEPISYPPVEWRRYVRKDGILTISRWNYKSLKWQAPAKNVFFDPVTVIGVLVKRKGIGGTIEEVVTLDGLHDNDVAIGYYTKCVVWPDNMMLVERVS